MSIKLNTPRTDTAPRTRLEKREQRFKALRRWFDRVLREQRALDEQVTAPLLRRYRQQKSRRVVE